MYTRVRVGRFQYLWSVKIKFHDYDTSYFMSYNHRPPTNPGFSLQYLNTAADFLLETDFAVSSPFLIDPAAQLHHTLKIFRVQFCFAVSGLLCCELLAMLSHK